MARSPVSVPRKTGHACVPEEGRLDRIDRSGEVA